MHLNKLVLSREEELLEVQLLDFKQSSPRLANKLKIVRLKSRNLRKDLHSEQMTVSQFNF